MPTQKMHDKMTLFLRDLKSLKGVRRLYLWVLGLRDACRLVRFTINHEIRYRGGAVVLSKQNSCFSAGCNSRALGQRYLVAAETPCPQPPDSP